MNIALFPGSFDPITVAHVDIIQRAQGLFDKIYISIGTNSAKKNLIPLERRLAILEDVFQDHKKVVISSYKGLTVDYAAEIGARYILRGLRSVSDFEYERPIAQNNQQLAPAIETVFLVAQPPFAHISSTIVRDIYAHQGDISSLIPFDVRRVES